MHAAFKILGVILIAFITIAVTIIAVIWVIPTIEKLIQLNEFQTVRNQFYECNDKIMETVRTGSTNECYFSVERGQLTVDTESIHYRIISETDICDPHQWTQQKEEKYVWQRCEVSATHRIFELMWNFSSYVEFQFPTEVLGKVVEISRVDITESKVILKVT